MLHQGQKVVCVDASETKALTEGATYTVLSTEHEFGHGLIRVDCWEDGGNGWRRERFRPAVTPGMSKLTEILERPHKHLTLVDGN